MKSISIGTSRLTEEEIAAAERVLRSGYLRQGKECEAFEQEFAAKTGARYAVTCANGSAALHLAYMASLRPGDEVIVPSFTFIATASMLSLTGARPVFCDVDPRTYLIDLADATSKITKRTRAIVPVHLFGNAVAVDAVHEFASENNLIVIWDAAQAHRTTYNGKDIGSLGDFVCYSFYPSKNLFVGEGGMICTNDPEKEQRLRFLRSHGETGKYSHTMLGFNYRMTDVEAAIGREQINRLDDMIATRRRNAQKLSEGLARIPGIKVPVETPNSEHAWHQYSILVHPEEFGCDRNALAERLQNRGIATGVHYPYGLHQQPIFKELYGTQHLTTTEYLASHILAIPVHHGLGEEDVEGIVEAVEAVRG